MKRRFMALNIALLLWVSTLFTSGPPALVPAAQGAGTALKTSTIRVRGLRANVIVRRDDRGVPYVDASNEEDLYFAQGYILASDRLWQMDLLRRTARGELSEILGAAALEEDKRRRAFGFAALAEQMPGRVSQPVRLALESYARGVNAFIESADQNDLPKECRMLGYKPRLWCSADSLVIGKLFAESLSTSWHTDLTRAALAGIPGERRNQLLPRSSPLDVIIVGSDKAVSTESPQRGLGSSGSEAMTAELFAEASKSVNLMRRSLERVGLGTDGSAASNNWVVNGRRSATGKPLLANDPHLEPSAPCIWYMIHMTAPGLRAAGVTIPGAPGIVIGHNKQMAWGITNVGADVQDLYMERFDSQDPTRYLTPAGWRTAQVRREIIKVRKSPYDPALTTAELDVTVTRNGPIILDSKGVRYALAWPALDLWANELEVYYYINRAQDWLAFRSALSRYSGFPLNFVYADTDGRIGHWAAGRYPIRRKGSGSAPHDGTSDAGDWVGFIAFEQTPHVYDPPTGIIVTANNRIVGTGYPHYITESWIPPYRARRIYNLLAAKEALSVEYFREIQADTYSVPDAIFGAAVVELARRAIKGEPEWRHLLDAFEGWDAMMNVESHGIVLSFMMRNAFQRRVIAGALDDGLMQVYDWGNANAFFDRVITTRPREWLPPEFDSYEALLLACYRDALEALTKRLGPDKTRWRWGNFARARFRHPLADAPGGHVFKIDPFPQNGGGQAVNKGASVSMRFIADVSDWDNTRLGIALGESGNPLSPHWKDQLDDWRSVNPRTFPFSEGAVARATRDALILAPSGNSR